MTRKSFSRELNRLDKTIHKAQTICACQDEGLSCAELEIYRREFIARKLQERQRLVNEYAKTL
jgi:hypothetical protein